jgi:hypothetical protein
VVEVLLNNGAAVNQATTDQGATPLSVATQNGHAEVVRILRQTTDTVVMDHIVRRALAASAVRAANPLTTTAPFPDADSVGPTGNTPLVMVCSEGSVRVIRQKFTLEDAIGSHACSHEARSCL